MALAFKKQTEVWQHSFEKYYMVSWPLYIR